MNFLYMMQKALTIKEKADKSYHHHHHQTDFTSSAVL